MKVLKFLTARSLGFIASWLSAFSAFELLGFQVSQLYSLQAFQPFAMSYELFFEP
jgi:hypothetical protein